MTAERQVSGRRVAWVAAALLIVLIAAGALTLGARRAGFHVLERDTEGQAIPTVAVIHPTAGGADADLVLPSTLQAYIESPIYARTNGYLLKWYKDIGSHIQRGERLADIETPEID